MNTVYCTYFDKHYLARGLAMINSLQAHEPTAQLVVLCLDKITRLLLAQLKIPGISLLTLEEMENCYPELLTVKHERSVAEYCWTLTPFLLLHLMRQQKSEDSVIYLDADQLFFSSPKPLSNALKHHSVILQSHNFPARLQHLMQYGKYNVGALGTRNDTSAQTVISWWRDRCLEWCFARIEGEMRYGDQKYLDFFSQQASGVGEFQHPGIGVAPWNCENNTFSYNASGKILFGKVPLVLFHYHSLVIAHPDVVIPSHINAAYRLSKNVIEHCYAPYMAALDQAFSQLRAIDQHFNYGFSKTKLDDSTPLLVRNRQVNEWCAGLPHVKHPLPGNFTYLEPKSAPEVTNRPRNNMWVGNFASWEEASNASTGYDTQEIMQKILAGARMARDNPSLCERDGVILSERQYLWPTLSGILLGAARNNGEVHVLDFGGAFGSTYRTMRPFLQNLKKIRWHVVELPDVVAIGKKEFQTKELLFHDSIEACLAQYRVDGILLGAVLQYLPKPYELLTSFTERQFDYIILDRTPFQPGGGERLCVQHVPESIYKASYPCWILDYNKCICMLSQQHVITETLPALEGTMQQIEFKGIITTRKTHANSSNSAIKLSDADNAATNYNTTTLAPITLFAFNRPMHLKRTLAALADNVLADKSELIIYCDGAKPGDKAENINAVRDIAHAATGFASVTVHERNINWGLAANIINGVSATVASYGRVIVLEDDMVTSPYFLRYMNDGLECYNDEPRAASIHGWCFPHTITDAPKTFFLKGGDCWGWATWKRAWKIFDPDAKKLLQQLKAKGLEYEFNVDNTYNYIKMLEDHRDGKVNSWAIRWRAATFLSNMYTLYPGQSFVQNIGLDASGTHCAATDKMDSALYNKVLSIYPIPVEEHTLMREAFKSFNLNLGKK